jgi:chromosome partitioning related protein ParA
VLLLDLDVQPTLSSYFTLAERAPAGIYEMLAYNEQRAEQLVSRTAIERLDLVLERRPRRAEHAAAARARWRLRLRHLLPTLAPHYDLLLIDTQGAQRAAGDGGAGLRPWRCRR